MGLFGGNDEGWYGDDQIILGLQHENLKLTRLLFELIGSLGGLGLGTDEVWAWYHEQLTINHKREIEAEETKKRKEERDKARVVELERELAALKGGK